MSSNEEDTWPTTWPAWVVEIANELKVAEGTEAEEFLPADSPPWVESLCRELLGAMFSKLNVDDFKESGPRFVGLLLGHHKRLIDGSKGFDLAMDRAMEAVEQISAELQQRLTKEQFERLTAKGQEELEDASRVIDRKEQALRRGILLALDQPADEQVEFFEGYSTALKDEIYDSNGRLAHETFPNIAVLYLFMVLNWRGIQQMPSVPQLYKWLGTLVPPDQLGDIDRLRGICKRHKLKLAGRGRPRKKLGR